jgi:hypothetical protein
MHPLDRTGVQAEYLSSFWINVLHSTGILGLSIVVKGFISILMQASQKVDAAAILLALAICANATSPFLLQFPWIAIGFILKKAVK